MAIGAVQRIFTFPGISGLPPTKGQDVMAIYEIFGEASYTTGGIAITAGTLGLTTLRFAVAIGCGAAAGLTNCPVPSFDNTNGKLQLFGTAAAATGLTECTAAGNFGAVKIYLLVNGVA